MADKDVSKPAEPPKPVHIGGESIVDRIIPHIKKIAIGAVVASVVIAAILAIRWWKQHGEEKETEKLASVLGVAERPVAAPGATPDPKNPAYASIKERASAVLEELAKQGTNKAGPAYRGGLLMDAEKLDEAIATYKEGQVVEGIEGVLSREGLGIALEAKATLEKDATAQNKLLQDALAAFTAMQPDEKGPRRAYALYHQGRILQKLQKRAEAKTAYEKAKEAGPGLDILELIEKRLATLGAA
jgi:tetratricopeptide (TPR) repeat protein